MNASQYRGFTLVELLVVIAIIGVLIGMMLPAVQSAREAARRLDCSNNLKQLSLAVLSHESALHRFPTGGWGWMWVGDPDRGNGPNQPGGWAYNILPFLEQNILHNLGAGLPEHDKKDAAAQMLSVPLPEFICPSRRAAKLYPYHSGYSPQTFNANPVQVAARTDYAINKGDFYVDAGEGPRYYDDASYKWPDTSLVTGISFVRSSIQGRDISDGMSNTYLIGEKYLKSDEYASGKDYGDDSSLYQGDDMDVARYTALGSIKGDQIVYELLQPLKDMRIYIDYYCFGSAHPTTWQASFCDGSVHSLSYDIDPELHRRLGNRCDGELVDKSNL
jgi:prepilin-type N-terminal cleavage/methylation domain-containing protein